MGYIFKASYLLNEGGDIKFFDIEFGAMEVLINTLYFATYKAETITIDTVILIYESMLWAKELPV